MDYQHGGDVYTYAERFGTQPVLDFSANINPRGIPAPLRQAMRDAVDDCVRYPDPQCRALTAALAARWALTPDQIFCGNGAAEIFFRLAACIRPRTALLPAPTFGEYEAALALTSCTVRLHRLARADGFALDAGVLDALTPDVDLFVLCNPNNPTGRTADPALCARIVQRCIQNDIWLIADECFGDFLVDEAAHTLRPALEQWHKLVVVRAFTKMYAVPGVRLGYCMCAGRTLIDRLYAAGQPWPVSSIAQAAGLAALTACAGWAQDSARQTARDRAVLMDGLRGCGLTVYPSAVNFVLFHTRDTGLRARLLPHGILLRDCSNYHGLAAGDLRAAVRSADDNARLIQAIQEELDNG